MPAEGQLTDTQKIRDFILGGYATFTLVSKRTGERKTFMVTEAPPRNPNETGGYFVKLLTGPDNTGDYTYLCFLFKHRDGTYQCKLNSKQWGESAFAAFTWLIRHTVNANQLVVQGRFHEQAEFWHVGRCCRCGRDLTTPESIAAGIGPVCAERS